MDWLPRCEAIESALRVYLHIGKRLDLQTESRAYLRSVNTLGVGALSAVHVAFHLPHVPEDIRKLNDYDEQGYEIISDEDLSTVYDAIEYNVHEGITNLRGNIRKGVRPTVERKDFQFFIARGIQSRFYYVSPFQESVALTTRYGHPWLTEIGPTLPGTVRR